MRDCRSRIALRSMRATDKSTCDRPLPFRGNRGHAAAQSLDQRLAVPQVLLLGIENAVEGPLLERADVELAAIETCRIADDLDQPVGRVQAPQEIVVLPIGAREE